MSEKIYFHLLLLCGILCQGIFASLSDNNTRLSSDFLVRKRRVINHLPGGRNPLRIEDINYIVKIKGGSRTTCAGAILSHHTVITYDACVHHNVSFYKVSSGAAGNTGYNLHNVTSKVEYAGNPPHFLFESVALLLVDPPFVYSARTGPIALHAGRPLDVGMLVTIYGWGCFHHLQPGPEVRMRLRSIIVPIISNLQCQNWYLNHFTVSEKHICTYDQDQYCAKNDEGAPVVFNNRLIGIHIWKGTYVNQRNPDVFLNLQRPDYIHWIIENTV